MSETKQSNSKVCKKINVIAGASLAALLLMGSSYFIANQHSHKQGFLIDQTINLNGSISEYPFYWNHPHDSFAQFLNFIATHNKALEYPNKQEFENRYQKFKSNYDRIVRINRIEDAGFTLEINQFTDLDDQEFVSKYASGLNIPEKRRQKAEAIVNLEESENKIQNKVQRLLQDDSNIPNYKNWYEEGYVSQPYAQGSCGGCWAFSTAAAVESLAKIKGVDKELQEYSVQQLLDCDGDNYGCTGGWMYQGFAYVSKFGILKKTDYKNYQQKKGLCNDGKNATNFAVHMKDIGYIEHDRRTNEQLRELVLQQPISIGVYTSGMMGAYRQGVMTDDFLHCSYGDREVNHGVLLVGYGKVTSHDRVNGRCKWYWIIRNSWGPTWGENGFFKICADNYPSKQLPYGTCLVNKYSVWPTMNKSDIDPDFEI